MDRQKIIIKTSIKGIIVNLILVAFKAIVGFLANSVMIILDAVNNLSDALSSTITIAGAKLAAKMPDKEHPYGHGRIEYLASLFIAIIIFTAGIGAFKESIEKIIHPVHSNYTIISLVVITVAVITKFVLGTYVKNTGKKINSQSLIASGTDALFDGIISLSTLIAAIVSMIWHINLEGILGAIISIFIFKSSIEILKVTINDMIGSRIDEELAKKIKETINSFEVVEGAYDLILHNYGPTGMIGSVHIQVPDEMTAKEIHTLTKEIEMKVYKEFNIILTIGIYAANTSDKKFANVKSDLEQIIKKYESILQLHGFYVDTRTNNIMFDLIIDFNEKDPKGVKDRVVLEIKEKYPEYEYSVIIDNDYSD